VGNSPEVHVENRSGTSPDLDRPTESDTRRSIGAVTRLESRFARFRRRQVPKLGIRPNRIATLRSSRRTRRLAKSIGRSTASPPRAVAARPVRPYRNRCRVGGRCVEERREKSDPCVV